MPCALAIERLAVNAPALPELYHGNRHLLSQVTGEHTCVVLRPLRSPEVEDTDWLGPFYSDFRLRFMSLLPGAFRSVRLHCEISHELGSLILAIWD